MAYNARYIGGVAISGAPSNVKRVQGVKRKAAGNVILTAAPNTKTTFAGLAATGATAKTGTVGLTGLAGHDGRNYVYGKISVVNTATKAHTVAVKAKTLAGTVALLTTVLGAAKVATKTFSNTLDIPFDVPGSIIAAVTPTGGKLTSIKLISLQVNAMTTLMF